MAKSPTPVADLKRPAPAPGFPLMPAIERLDAAIARLETAVDAHARRTAEERRSLDAALARTGEERQSLNAALAALRDDHAALQAEARTVAAKLDSVIGRLKAVADDA